jgi:DNA-binding beta-propeller fold protein YncE
MLFRLLTATLIAAFCHAQPGIITTIVGTGVAGDAGDGGPGRNAQVNNPNGVAVDSAGNVYIADYGSNKIRKLLIATTYSRALGRSAR